MRTLDAWPQIDPLTARASSTPDHTAVIEAATGSTWTYEALFDEVDRLAGRLLAGLDGRPERLGIAMETGVAFVRSVHAAWRLGAAVVPLDVREPTEQVAAFGERAGVDAVLCSTRTAEHCTDIDSLPVYTVARESAAGVAALPTNGTDTTPRARYPSETHLVMFTSGSTGDPAGVQLTLTNLFASAIASGFRLGVDPADRWLVAIPMAHMGGFAPIVRSTLYGTTLVLQREFETERTATVMDEFDVTGVSFVPTMLTRMLDAGWTVPLSLRFVLLGGAAASRDLVERSEREGIPVYPTYGMTETASQVATATPAQTFDTPKTVGQPLLFTQVAIIGDDGPCSPGETGEIVIEGPTVTPGYLREEETDAVFDERGLHTGDLGYRDENGRLYVVGRQDDRIVTGGENVDREEVAAAIKSRPDVAEVAVVGIPDDEWGEVVAALVVPDGATGPTETEIESTCRDRLAEYKVPKAIAIGDAIPRTVSGTIDRAAVVERIRHQ